MTKTIKRKAYLSNQTHDNLQRFLEQLRFLYNKSLAERKTAYEKDKTQISLSDQQKKLTRRRRFPIWGEGLLKAQRTPLRRIDKAFKSFFRRVKKGDAPGFPRFIGWKRGFRSFDLGCQVPKVKQQKSYQSIKIKNIGSFKFKQPLPEGKIKDVRVVKKPTRVELQFIMDTPNNSTVDLRDPIGIDVGIKSRATLSTGHQIPKNILNRTEIKRKQRILSRAQKNSNNRNKKRISLKKEWQRVTEKERGKLHEITSNLIKDHSNKFAVEDLQIKNMVKNKKLSRSIMEQHWGLFIQMLSYKAESAGGELIKVDPKNTTQRCSECGHIPDKKLTLSDRTYNCISCGLSEDRDINAAKNILQRGYSSLPGGTQVALKTNNFEANPGMLGDETYQGSSEFLEQHRKMLAA